MATAYREAIAEKERERLRFIEEVSTEILKAVYRMPEAANS